MQEKKGWFIAEARREKIMIIAKAQKTKWVVIKHSIILI